MGVLSTLVLADPKDARLVSDSSNPIAEFGGLEVDGIDGILLGELYCVLEGTPSTVDFVVNFMGEVLYQASDEGPWVEEVPPRLTEWLALLDGDELSRAAKKWAECEEMVSRHGSSTSPADDSFLRDLADLARQAVERKKSLLLWTSL